MHENFSKLYTKMDVNYVRFHYDISVVSEIFALLFESPINLYMFQAICFWDSKLDIHFNFGKRTIKLSVATAVPCTYCCQFYSIKVSLK